MSYVLKAKPEDFVVVEVPISFLDEGKFFILKITKKNFNTEDVAKRLSRFFGVPRKYIGYAGAKDKRAITKQYFSVFNINKVNKMINKNFNEPIVIYDSEDRIISIEFIGFLNKPISLGDLKKNHFKIVLRNLDNPLPPGTINRCIKNYFGPQRFGMNNSDIGKKLVKKEFKKVVKLINPSFLGNDYINFLNKLSRHTLMIYLHAYQSFLWNKILRDIDVVPKVLPIIGFGTELDNFSVEIKKKYSELLIKEGISQRDFVIKQLKGLSQEGDVRKTMISVNIAVDEPKIDELNVLKKKQLIEFDLPKGSYATVIIDSLFF